MNQIEPREVVVEMLQFMGMSVHDLADGYIDPHELAAMVEAETQDPTLGTLTDEQVGLLLTIEHMFTDSITPTNLAYLFDDLIEPRLGKGQRVRCKVSEDFDDLTVRVEVDVKIGDHMYPVAVSTTYSKIRGLNSCGGVYEVVKCQLEKIQRNAAQWEVDKRKEWPA